MQQPPSAGIRLALQEDTDDVNTVVREAFSAYIPRLGRPPKPMTEDYRQAVSAGRVWVAEVASQVRGALVLERFTDHVLVETTAVDAVMHRTGIGSPLLRHAEHQAEDAVVPETAPVHA